MKPKPLATIGDELRRAVRKSGLTHYRIAKNAGIKPEQIDRFIGGQDIRLSTAGKIALALGLELRNCGTAARKASGHDERNDS